MKSLAVIVLLLIVSSDLSYGRVYDMCSLARELHNSHGISKADLPHWVCIAEHESRFDTSAMNRHNTDSSWDWGIFQINDEFWCFNPDRAGKSNDCHINCNQLLSSDITAAVQCATIIKNRHGWKAWVAWNKKCQGTLPNTDICFGDIGSSHGYGAFQLGC